MAKHRQITTRIPEDLARKVRVKAAKKDVTITSILQKLLAKWVEEDDDKDT